MVVKLVFSVFSLSAIVTEVVSTRVVGLSWSGYITDEERSAINHLKLESDTTSVTIAL